jgi:hypothetical protein
MLNFGAIGEARLGLQLLFCFTRMRCQH